MPLQTGYLPGAPCWIDRITADLPAAMTEYSRLFGWDFTEDGDYVTARHRREIVAGFGTTTQRQEFWTVYLASSDLERTAAQVVALGGSILMTPRNVGANGRLLLAADPAGGLVGFWEGHRAEGVFLAQEPASAARYELRTSSVEVAAGFYGGLLGYRLVHDAGRLSMHLTAGSPVTVVQTPGPRTQWLVYFGVSDLVDALGRVLDSGGRVIARNDDGSLVLADSLGARFGLTACPAEQSEGNAPAHRVPV